MKKKTRIDLFDKKEYIKNRLLKLLKKGVKHGKNDKKDGEKDGRKPGQSKPGKQ